ncbi:MULTISPECIES: hypothetical protein [Anabaena]|uniref:Uncharacterized protein n=1 Tax=Anabaena cylindrica (strain ATCC 27899 / PCC 7122) TaxID=272123 RepID=K9ZQJ2_ANACC|nr:MULTISPECIES: hypothetical protein [Anabaena]AFZ61446.1 hypothetical protein Anacy_6177 [Anabaena cylindrica PCC 7122]
MSDDRYLYPIPSSVQIETLIFTNNQILMVFYTAAHAWEFRIISSDGWVYGKKGIYYTADAALKVAREWVQI